MKLFILLISALFFITTSFSQSIREDSLAYIQVKNAVDIYNNYTGDNALLYNGKDYLYYNFKMEGDPFFITGNLSKGWVVYQGRMYDTVSIGYDIQRNQLGVRSPDNLARIVLQNEWVDSFHLLEHTFINLKVDHEQNLYNSGFYDLLYNGCIQLLARRIKTMEQVIKDNSLVNVFTEKDLFYIHKGGLYYLVTNKKDVFRLFAGKAHDIKKMMRHDHIKFGRKNFESPLLKTTAFYDRLTD